MHKKTDTIYMTDRGLNSWVTIDRVTCTISDMQLSLSSIRHELDHHTVEIHAVQEESHHIV